MRRFVGMLGIPLLLAACGGGGSGTGLSEQELMDLQSDPRVQRLSRIVDGADTLLMSNVRNRWRITVQGYTEAETEAVQMFCADTECRGTDGSVITIADLLDPTVATDLTGVEIGSREGLDTFRVTGKFDDVGIPDVTLTALPEPQAYGAWGEYGYAVANVMDGPVAGSVDGIAFQGHASAATAFAVGDTTGANPAGAGSATWRGVAQAVSLNTFQPQFGSVVVRIPDLERPRVDVAVDLDGRSITAPSWTGMPLVQGHYENGRPGSRDYLAGDFYGPRAEETYGVFGTAAYVGSFGARH